MSEPSGAEFLFRMAKSARKHWAGLTVVTQDAADLLGSPLGQAVVANAATQILLRQAPQSIDTLAEAFGLSAGERAYLLGAARGQGLLAAGVDRVAFTALASPEEDDDVPDRDRADPRRHPRPLTPTPNRSDPARVTRAPCPADPELPIPDRDRAHSPATSPTPEPKRPGCSITSARRSPISASPPARPLSPQCCRWP